MPNLSIIAYQNLNKNCFEKDNKQEKRKYWKRREKDRKKRNHETPATKSNVKSLEKTSRKPDHS